MNRKLALLVSLALLTAMLGAAFRVDAAEWRVINILANGSVLPSSAPIQRNGDVYTLTGDNYGAIDVHRDNIVIDGANHTIIGVGWKKDIYGGIRLWRTTNVTIRNIEIREFYYGISLQSSSSKNFFIQNTITNNLIGIYLDHSSSNNSIIRNKITSNEFGILFHSFCNRIVGNEITDNTYGVTLEIAYLGKIFDYNSISENSITANDKFGIWLLHSSNCSITGNNIAHNYYGISLDMSSDFNSIVGNKITANTIYGVNLYRSSNNSIYHNSFVDNMIQAYTQNSANVWDDSYPSGGNYWSDYNGIDLYSGFYQNETNFDWIGDSQYVLNKDNQDKYPLILPKFVSEETRIAYRNLFSRYIELLSEFKTLNLTSYALLSNISDLQRRVSMVNSTLTSGQETIMNELRNIRNLIGIFIITTIILIATIIYVSKRKPKPENHTKFSI